MSGSNEALQAAARASGAARLEHLIAAWQATRQPEIAELVAAHAASLGLCLAADPNDLDAWYERAPEPSAHERTELLERIDKTNWKKAFSQLRLIAEWPADPRTATTLVELIARAPYRSDPATELWTRVYALLIELGDPRSLATLPEPESYARQFPRDKTKRWIARHLAILREQLEALPSPTPLSEEDAALVEQLRPAAPTPNSEHELLAQIYAAPDDDAPRAVYADLLSSRGDPRGELIALQLLAKPGRQQKARIKELLRQHQMAWLGELGDIMLATDLRYERGFPAGGCLDGGASQDAIRRRTGNDAWRTFTALDVRGFRPGYVDFLAHEAFYGLRELTTVSPLALLKFIEPAPRGLRRVVTTGKFEDVPEPIVTGLFAGEGLPELRTLGVWFDSSRHRTQLDRLLRTPLGQRLTRLEVEHGSQAAGSNEEWVAMLLGTDHSLREIELRCNSREAGFQYRLERGEQGWAITASFRAGANQAENFQLLAQLLGRLERVEITKVVVETSRYTPEKLAVMKLRRAARGAELVV